MLIRLTDDEEDQVSQISTGANTLKKALKELGLDSKVWTVFDKLSKLSQSYQNHETSLQFKKLDNLQRSSVTLTIPRGLDRIKCMRFMTDKDIDLC